MAAVPKAPQAAPPATPYSILTSTVVFIQPPSHHRKPCRVLLPNSSEGAQSGLLFRIRTTPSLFTEQEKLTGIEMKVILLLKYSGPGFNNYRGTYYSHSFYLQSVLHPINTYLCQMQCNETADIL